MKRLATLIIAAGNSSRLGQPKQLVAMGGQSLLRRTAQLALQHNDNVFCVLGYQPTLIANEINDLPLTSLLHKDWQVGMGSTIAHGVEEIAGRYDAALILLCDQWALTGDDLQNLINRWQRSPDTIVASQYFDARLNRQVQGAPAIFPRAYFPQLRQLTDTGARKILQQNSNQVNSVTLKSAAFDLDTPTDLAYFQQVNSQ